MIRIYPSKKYFAGYALYLDADYYDYDDLAKIAESVTFSEDAFTAK